MEAPTDTQIAQPTIAEVLAEFLAEQGECLSDKIFARYRQVIGLLTNSLNSYAYHGSLSIRRRTFQSRLQR